MQRQVRFRKMFAKSAYRRLFLAQTSSRCGMLSAPWGWRS
jgi:hypothetical protein